MAMDSGIDALVEGWRRRVGKDEPGFGAGVWGAEGDVTYHCSGRARRGGPRIGPQTIFDLASVSKMFTGLGLFLLLEEKGLSLDTRLAAILPEMTAAAPDVRLRHLLHHTSGLPDYMELFAERGLGTDKRLGMRETLAILSAQLPGERGPGSAFSYSNTGYVLLSAVIERLSGATMAEYAKKRIFGPLGMKRTCVVDRMPLRGPDVAISYVDGRDAEINPVWDMTGDGQVYTCLQDMGAWVSELTSPRRFPSAITQLLTRGALDDGAILEYGGGIQFETLGQKTFFGHDGGWAGFSSLLLVEPRRKFATIVLANRLDLEAGQIGRDIAVLAAC